MTRVKEPAGDVRAEDAINLVLEAERRAREKVARCESEAAARVAAARGGAWHIAERTDRRITTLRTRCELWLLRRVAELRAETEAVRNQPTSIDARDPALIEAVARLAARLTDSGP